MTVNKSKVRLLTLSESQAQELLEQSLKQGFKLDILDSRGLGNEWSRVTIYAAKDSDNKIASTDIDKVLADSMPSGKFAGFMDSRAESSVSDLQSSLEREEGLSKLVSGVIEYKNLSAKLEDSQSKKTLKDQAKTREGLEIELLKLGQQANTAAKIRDNFKIKELAEQIKAVELKLKDLENSSSNALAIKTEESKIKLLEKGIDPDNISAEQVEILSNYYSYHELTDRKERALSNLFKVKSDASDYFAFAAVNTEDETKLLKTLDNLNIFSKETEWDKEVVVWKEKGGLNSFKAVAENLGVTGSNETNPTWVVAIFFMLFFAFCLADALYAGIIAAFTGFFLLRDSQGAIKLKAGFKSFFGLFFFSSLLTIAFGVLTGSWGGDLFAGIATKLGLPGVNEFFAKLQVIDYNLSSFAPQNVSFPVNEGIANAGIISNPVIFMLMLAAGIGLIHTIIGFALKARNEKMEGNQMAFLSEMNWVFFVVLGILYLVFSIAMPVLQIPFAIAFGLSTIGLFVLNTAKGIPGKIISGLGRIYGLVGVFADSMSYTRLVAVGLTGGIISLVINLLALNMVSGPGDIVGWFFATLILIIGHTLNMVITLFGAYINPLRLHFVEFMPKFYKGSSKAFSYDLDDLKYVEIKE